MESKVLLTSIFVSITALILGVSLERYLFRIVNELAPTVWSSLMWQTIYIIILFVIVILLATNLIPKFEGITIKDTKKT
jgi:type IV secretory pathway VirB3-like protein